MTYSTNSPRFKAGDYVTHKHIPEYGIGVIRVAWPESYYEEEEPCYVVLFEHRGSQEFIVGDSVLELDALHSLAKL
jgi:hypothetical protein